MYNHKQNSDYPIIQYNGRKVSDLILLNCSTPRRRNYQSYNQPRKPAKQNSLTHCFKLLRTEKLEEDPITTLPTDKQIRSKKFINLKPLKNAIAKITNMRQEILSRRKSAYGEMFGELTAKQLQNLPTLIEQHKQIDGQRFALTSFADILERKKQKRTTRKPSLLRKLSKQETVLVEYDHLERPPSCKTPPKQQLITKLTQKSKIQLEQEKYFKGLDSKMLHFLAGKQDKLKEKTTGRTKAYTGIQATTPQSSTLMFLNQRNSIMFPQLCVNKISRCITNSYEKKYGPQLSNRSNFHDGPYVKQNKILSKQIQSEIKNLSHSLQRSSYQL